MNSKMTEKEAPTGHASIHRLCGEVDGQLCFLDSRQGEEVCRRAMAYPGLHAAANSLLIALSVSRGRAVEDMARALGVVLAGSPKP